MTRRGVVEVLFSEPRVAEHAPASHVAADEPETKLPVGVDAGHSNCDYRRDGRVVKGARLLSESPSRMGTWVRIPVSPPTSCGISSIGRVPACHAGGKGFETPMSRQESMRP